MTANIKPPGIIRPLAGGVEYDAAEDIAEWVTTHLSDKDIPDLRALSVLSNAMAIILERLGQSSEVAPRVGLGAQMVMQHRMDDAS